MEATVTAAAAGMIDVGGDLTVNRLEYGPLGAGYRTGGPSTCARLARAAWPGCGS
jgi:hypothetical protein